MAAPNPSKVVTNPRIAKLIELEVAGKIKAEHQRELDTYRAEGLAPKKAAGSLTEYQGKSAGFYTRALGSNSDFEATEAAIKPRGQIGAAAAAVLPTNVVNAHTSPDRQKAEQAKRDFIAASLRYESGAVIGQNEFDNQDRMFFPQTGDDAATIAQKVQARQRVIESLKVAAGPGATSVETKPAGTTDQSAAPPIVSANDSPPPAPDAPPSSSGGPAAFGPGGITDVQGAFGGGPQGDAAAEPDRLALATNGVRTELDPELDGLRKQVAGMVAAGASAKAIRSYLSTAGVDPAGVQNIDEVVAWRKAHPSYKGGYSVQIGQRDIPMGAARSALSAAAASPGGAYGITAADTILGGGLDELAPGNTALNRLGIDAVEAANPNAAGLGTATGIVGNVATTIGGEGLLARGIPALGRFAAPVADTAFGVTTGALSNNDDRLTGALTGGATAYGGGVLGRKLVSAVGRAVAPSGGKLTELYDAGVRPTIGQRFVGTSTVGNAVNGVEEVLQSFPGLGFAVRGARQKARDQFERGAFDSALGEIGHKLPEGIELGTAPHGYMQKAFSEAYDRVLPNMRAVADDAFTNATQTILDQVANGGLSDDSANRFGKIIQAQITRRLGDAGEMSGEDLKQATSAIGKQIQNLRSSPQGDRELAAALEDYVGELKASAMRNSDPGAAAALDAVDRGYAKAVRIEDAASARGGDTGRFTPAQFDRYVQKDAGGVRSRAYLRGDALFGDYAEAGKSLSDRIPNSGTPERMMTMQALGGAPVMSALGYASPVSAALVGAATLPYAPIARDAVGAAMAPRNNPLARTLGDLIRQRAQLGGAAGVPLALSATGQ